MSKLGIHISAGNRRGFGEFLQACALHESAVPVIQTVDQNVWDDVQKFSPSTTIIVYRTQLNAAGKSIGDGPGAMYTGEPNSEAERWMYQIMPCWRRNRAHFYAPINEQDGGPAKDMDWLNIFLLRCMAIAQDNDFKLAGPNFSAGNPRDDSIVTKIINALFKHRVPVLVSRLNLSVARSRAYAAALGVVTTGSAEDRWQRLIPAMQAAKAGGHILTLHQYGLQFGTLMASAPYLALRHRRDIAFLAQHNAVPQIVINECGPGVGGIGKSQATWLSDLKAYDAQLMNDRDVIGSCVYQLGGAENIVNGLGALGAYISTTPTPPPDRQTITITLNDVDRFEHTVEATWTTHRAVLSTAPDVNVRIE